MTTTIWRALCLVFLAYCASSQAVKTAHDTIQAIGKPKVVVPFPSPLIGTNHLKPLQPLNPVHDTTSPTVKTTHGTIEGITKKNFNGKAVDAFLGIPYVSPPVGANRFLPPQPLAPWEGTLETKNMPVSCVQAATDLAKKVFLPLSESTESEDCLYANLWRPAGSENRKLPIMVYIHGGGYFGGSCNVPLYDGSVLAAEQDVIVFNFNYRGSAWGFYYLGEPGAEGNAGLRDQIVAMQWIKKNVHNFGGDPHKITIFGESAGSISIACHTTNRELDDLYRYAIMESGTIDMRWITRTQEDMKNISLTFTENVGCPTTGWKDARDCMNSKSVSHLLKYINLSPTYLNIGFVPVRNGREVPFEPKGAANNVPADCRKDIISGNIRNDFGYFTPSFMPPQNFDENYCVTKEDWDGLVGKNYYGLEEEGLRNALTHEYVSPSSNQSNFREAAASCIADSYCQCPQLNYTREWATGKNRVYYYHFEHRPSKAAKTAVPLWLGPTHGDELPFVFGLPLNPSNNYTEAEKTLSEQMMCRWGSFAKTGNPNGPCLNGTSTWPSLQPGGKLRYLIFNEKISTASNLKERECNFWENVYPGLVVAQQKLNQMQ